MFKIRYCIILKGEEGITNRLVFVFFMTRGGGASKLFALGAKETSYASAVSYIHTRCIDMYG